MRRTEETNESKAEDGGEMVGRTVVVVWFIVSRRLTCSLHCIAPQSLGS